MVYFYALISLGLVCLYYFIIHEYVRAWNMGNAGLKEQPVASTVFVSIVVIARNEEHHIAQLMECLFHQSYDRNQYEVIIVDDHSSDGTFELLNTYNYSNLLVLRNPSNLKGKKAALNFATSKVKGELILFTDADCVVGPQWVENYVRLYIKEGCMTTGPVIIKDRSSTIKEFQFLDLLGLMVLSGGAIAGKYHVMANGGNMAVPKRGMPQFPLLKGHQLASGDDIFLAEYYFQRQKLRFNFSLASIVVTHAQRTLWEVINQRRRWASKNVKIGSWPMKIRFAIVAGVIINVVLSFCLIATFELLGVFIFLLTLAIKCIAEYRLIQIGAKHIDEKVSFLTVLKHQWTQILVYSLSFVSALFRLQYYWKGRRVH